MSEVIFCKTRYQDKVVHVDSVTGKEHKGYASYEDLWKMVKWAGYPLIYVDQIDPQSDNTYIVTPLNEEWIAGWHKPKARIIHWEFEWRTDWRAEADEPEGVREVWAMDRWFAQQIGARYVPVGSDRRLNEYYLGAIPYLEKPAVALLAYQTNRRAVITQELRRAGIDISVVDGSWGKERSQRLYQSSLMLHVHQTDNMPGVAALRWALAAAHKLPIISEQINDRGIFGYSHMMQARYDFLTSFTSHMLKQPKALQDYGDALHNLLCVEQTFRKVVEAHV